MRQASVNLIFNLQGQVLLLERTAEHKHFPLEWCLPGGKREIEDVISNKPYGSYNPVKVGEEYSETINETNFRETFEETGIKAYACEQTPYVLIDDKFECIVFRALSRTHIVTEVFPNREHLQAKWFHKNELPEKLGKMTRDLLMGIDW